MPILDCKTQPAAVSFSDLPVWTDLSFPEAISMLSLAHGHSVSPSVAPVLILAHFLTFWLADSGPALSDDRRFEISHDLRLQMT